MPDALDANTLVPVVVENANGTKFSYQINSPIDTFNIFTIVCKISRVDLIGI